MRIAAILMLCLAALSGGIRPAHAESLDELTAILSGDKPVPETKPAPTPTSIPSGDHTPGLVAGQRWRCDIQNQVACKKGACTDIKPGDWLELDFADSTYTRCSKSKGCKGFPMVVNDSGDFIVAALPENGVTFKASEKDATFSEAASVGGIVVNSFGNCSKAAAEKPAHAPSKKLKEARKSVPAKPADNLHPVPDIPSPRSLSDSYQPFPAGSAAAATSAPGQPHVSQW